MSLSRYRRNDPGVTSKFPNIRQWIGYKDPSLDASFQETNDVDSLVEFPTLSLQRLMSELDNVAIVDVFGVFVRTAIAQMYGVRMCPDCPDCHNCEHPCIDIFGSNATPMGGCCGRADALIGFISSHSTVEDLEFNFCLFVQMAYQHLTLKDISSMIHRQLISKQDIQDFKGTVELQWTLPTTQNVTMKVRQKTLIITTGLNQLP